MFDRMGVLVGGVVLLLATGIPSGLAQESTTFDHTLFDAILRETVTDGVVDYAKLSLRYQDLQTYLSQLAQAPFDTLPREEKIAMAINAYNANCINAVLREGKKIKSVKDVWFFFKNTKFQLGGKEMTLDSLEHDTLRKMGEPRIHFAITRAARSCPKLASHAYRGATLETDLDQAARAFFLDPARNRLDRDKKTLYLNAMLKWFKKDFTTQATSIAAFVRPYLPEADQLFLKEQAVKVEFLDYDWGLNGHF